MPFKTMLNIIRFCFLFFFILSGVVIYAWKYEESIVNQIGKKIIRVYSSTYEKRLDDALSSKKNNPKQEIAKLESLLLDMEHVQKQDRLAHIKIKAFQYLISAHENRGSLTNALTIAEKWSAFDDRDLFGQFALATLLLKIPGNKIKGTHVLERLNRLSPSNPTFANLYAKTLLQEDKLVEAFLAIRQSIVTDKALKGKMWQIFWDEGSGFNSKHKDSFYPSFGLEGEFKIPFILPASVRALRLDPPPNIHLIIKDLILQQGNGADKITTELSKISLRFNQMTQVDNILKTSGENDPYVSWNLPSTSKNMSASFVISAKAHEELPRALYDLLDHPEADSLKSKLEAAGEKEAVAQLDSVIDKISRQDEFSNRFAKAQRFNRIQQGSIEVFWNQANGSFSADRKNALPFIGILEGDQLRFDLTIPINSELKQIRIDLPEGVGIQYFIESIDIFMDEKSRTENIDIAKTEVKLSQGLKIRGDALITIGGDPYFYFNIQKERSRIEEVRIRGRAQ